MRTAICFSGELRSIDKTIKNITSNIIEKFENPDIFIHLWNDDPNLNKLSFLDKGDLFKVIQIEKRKTFDEKNYASFKRTEVNVQGLLRQLYCVKACNTLKSEVEKSSKFVYDTVVRVRPDILIEEPTMIERHVVKPNTIYIPNHDDHHGYNDRFYYGKSHDMDILNNRFDLIDWFFNMGGRFHYETFFKFLLDYNDMEVERIPLRFGLLRANGEYLPPVDNILIDSTPNI